MNCGCVLDIQLHCFEMKRPNLKLKTIPKQLLGSFSLDNVIPAIGERES
jgi:hypothetical protein